VQPLDRISRLVAHHVRGRHEARQLSVHRDEDGSLAFLRQFLAPREETGLGDARLREEAPASDESPVTLDAGADAAARDCLESVDLGER
jgi:hypothetical protein